MKKQTASLYTWTLIIGLVIFIGWCVRSCSSPKVITLTSIDLEPNQIDTIVHPKDQYYSNFFRLGFSSLSEVKLDYNKYGMGELDDFGIEVKVQFKDGKTIESEFSLHGIQRGNHLILRGSSIHKKYHSFEEWEMLNNMSHETVKFIFIRIYEDDGYEFPTVSTKRFTNFGSISKSESEDYEYSEQ